MDLTHRNRFSQFTLCLGEFRSAAVKPACRYPPTAGRAWAHPTCSMIHKRFQNIPFCTANRKGRQNSPPRWGGGTAAVDFEAIKPRIFNAVAVGEMHPTDAPPPKRNLLLHKQNIYAIIVLYPKKGDSTTELSKSLWEMCKASPFCSGFPWW